MAIEPIIYNYLMLASGITISLMGLLLLSLHISAKGTLDKLRLTRILLASSYLVLGLLSFVCYFNGYNEFLERTTTLVVGSYQALLFTLTMTVFIRPERIHRKHLAWQLAAITLVGAVLSIVHFWNPAVYELLFHIAEVGYIAQLTIYTITFQRAYQQTLREVEEYYDEEEERRMRWVRYGFSSALCIGVMALLLPYCGPWFYFFFVVFYSVYYV